MSKRFQLFVEIKGAIEHFARIRFFTLESSSKVVVLLLDSVDSSLEKILCILNRTVIASMTEGFSCIF